MSAIQEQKTKPPCLDCGKQLKYLGTERCITCHLKSSKHKEHLADARLKLIGKPSPMKGRLHSQETKERISKSKIGVSAVWNIGKGHTAWNKIGDGVTPQNKLERAEFRRTMQGLVFQRDNYTCQICEAYGAPIQVDHIKRWSDYPELRFEMDNCRTLCMACHYYVTFKRKMPKGTIWGHNLSRGIS